MDYPLWSVLVTFTKFQGHSGVWKVKLKVAFLGSVFSFNRVQNRGRARHESCAVFKHLEKITHTMLFVILTCLPGRWWVHFPPQKIRNRHFIGHCLSEIFKFFLHFSNVPGINRLPFRLILLKHLLRFAVYYFSEYEFYHSVFYTIPGVSFTWGKVLSVSSLLPDVYFCWVYIFAVASSVQKMMVF